MFRRRRREESAEDYDDLEALEEGDEPDEADEVDEDAYDDEPEPAAAAQPDRPQGPWDLEDAPDDGLPRIDLGGLRVPVGESMEVRVDVQDDVVVAATLVHGVSAMQVGAFAAPRSAGIWDDVRQEIAESLQQSGGSAKEVDGPFGIELRARVPAEVPGQGAVLQPARFIGVDGPRWFVRALLTGPAATDPVQSRALEEAFRGVVVVRGGEAMAPRDMIPLHLPRDAQDVVEDDKQRRAIDPFERGPEITEVR